MTGDLQRRLDADELIALIATLPGFIYQLRMSPDQVFRYTYTGGALEAMFGVSEQAVLADAGVLLGMIHPDDYDEVIGSSLVSAENLQPWHAEFRMCLPDGRSIWVEAKDQPHKLEDGTIVWNGYASDITARKQLESALQASERRFRGFVENITDMLFTLDASTTITYVSPSWESRLDYRVADLIGQPFSAFVHPDEQESCRAFIARVLQQGREQQGLEYRLQHKDGSWRWFFSTASALQDENGSLYFLAVAHDITSRKKNEQKIRHLAMHDALTHLPNRTSLKQHLIQQLAALHENRSEDRLALLFLDLDHFKPVNDEYGHEAGDRLLLDVVRRLRSALRGNDFISRIGGDEFVVLLPGLKSAEAACDVAAKIRDALVEPFVVEGQQVRISCSIGIALAPDHARDVSGLLNRADEAMYMAKAAGRNRFVVWTESL